MGLKATWREDVFLRVQSIDSKITLLSSEPYYIIDTKKNFLIHLISLNNSFTSLEVLVLQGKYKVQGKLLVQLWEDVWHARKKQVVTRLYSFLGLNNSIHGRKTKIQTLDIKQISYFLNEYHLQGYVKAKYNFGLFNDSELVAVASFSNARPLISKGENYQSAELIRFASKDKITIVGGLSKLIKHFLKEVQVNDIMTYADRDWSLGKGYEKLGFALTKETASLLFYVNTETLIRYASHRLPKSLTESFNNKDALNFDHFLATKSYKKVYNTGNLKFHLFQ